MAKYGFVYDLSLLFAKQRLGTLDERVCFTASYWHYVINNH